MLALSHFSRDQLFATQWIVALHTALSMGLSNQESGVGGHAL